jgi:Tfp pilus assembly PilM family ATPase
MARFLALDGDSNRFQLLSANVKGDSVRLERSLIWDEDQPIGKNNAEAIGERLRAKLKEAGIAPAPLLVCLGRDRIIVKDIKIPKVPPHEEPAIVRFQALKELTEGGDDAVIDYVPVHSAAAERRVQIMAVRKDVIAAYKKLAEVAGLKLATISPRPFAILAGLNQAIAAGRVPPPGAANAAMAVLVRGDKWGEFSIVHHGEMTLSRSISGPPLNNDAALLGEIRRNLAVHANQNPEFPVRALYLAEPDTPGGLRERLQDSLAIPVHAFEPAVGVPVPDGPAGGLAGPAGLFALKGSGDLQINFIQPRQPKPPKDSFKKVLAIAAFKISVKKSKIAELQKQVTGTQKLLRESEPDSKRIKALQEWDQTDVNWLDELYDMTARMDKNSKNVRVVSLEFKPAEDHGNSKTKTKDKDKFAGTIQLKLISTRNQAAVNQFIAGFVADQNDNVNTYAVGARTSTKENKQIQPQDFPDEIVQKIEVHKRSVDQYSRTFTADTPPKRSGNRSAGGGGGRAAFGMPNANFMEIDP